MRKISNDRKGKQVNFNQLKKEFYRAREVCAQEGIGNNVSDEFYFEAVQDEMNRLKKENKNMKLRIKCFLHQEIYYAKMELKEEYKG